MNYWDQQAEHGDLRAVIDHNDKVGHKNAWIDCLTKTALSLHGSLSRNDSALDFGCGIGRITIWLGTYVRDVVGVDTSERMIERARANAQEAGASAIRFAAFDGPTLQFDQVFDVVTSVYVMECISDNPAFNRTISELSRVTRKGGRVLFIERTAEANPEEAWMPKGVILRRPIAEYYQAFLSAGLRCTKTIPIRDPGVICNSPRLNRMVLRGWIPKVALPFVARAHIGVKSRQTHMSEWVDHLFVCEKV